MSLTRLSFLRTVCVIVFLSLLSVGCTNSNKFSISGKIAGADGQILRLSQLNIEGIESVDSVKLGSSGSYSFEGKRLGEPTFFTLSINRQSITLLNDTNVKMVVNASLERMEENYQVNNSPESAYIKLLNGRLKSTLSEINVLQGKFEKCSSEIERAAVIAQINGVIEKHKNFLADFVSSHPRSFASYYAIYQKFDNNNFILNVLDKRDQVLYAAIATSLNIYYPKSERVRNLYNYVLNAKQQMANSKLNSLLKTLPTIGYPDLKIADKDGRIVTLSSLKGKVILLAFWASWSKESRAFNGELKRVYRKFGSKGLEIYQVSLDQNKLYWEAAMMQDELNWINVCEFTFPSAYSATIYNVSSLPANFLISKGGDIIGRNLEGSLLDDKISGSL